MRFPIVSSLSAALGVCLAVALAGCNALDNLIDVDPVDRIDGETLEVPGNAGILMAGAVGDFECAFASYVLATGTTADELMVTDGLTAQELYDRRTFETRGLGASYAQSTCSTHSEGTVGVYRPLSTARWQADNLLTLLDSWTDEQVPDRAGLIAKASAYAGYSYVLLGESMCQASIDLSPPLEPADLFARAEERFTRAIETATAIGDDEFLNMALVGRARVRLDLGRKADAGADAALVPDGFIKTAGYSSANSRRENTVYVETLSNVYSVDPQFRAVQFGGVPDPRVPVVNTGRVVTGVNIEVWTQTKYADRDSPIPVARWAEARLILAEADLDAGNTQGAVDIINELHTRAGLPAFASTDPAAVMAQLVYERSAELFLESQRFGDIRRLNLPLIPAPGTPYHAGGTYSDARCYPYPGIESDNNPNAS